MIASNSEKIRSSFTKQASGFENGTMNFTKREYLEYMISCVDPKVSDTVLEVASGTCICGRSFAPLVKKVICLDMTEAMLNVGRCEADKRGISNMEFVRGDAESLPFANESFDIVLSRLAFHHFSDPKKCFDEMTRVLKKGGKLAVIDMEAADEALRDTEDKIEKARDPSHVRNLSIKEFEEMFREARVKVVKENRTDIPVSLDAWLKLTDTPVDISNDISKHFLHEMEGGEKTGFKPYLLNGEIKFDQRWLMIIGEKE